MRYAFVAEHRPVFSIRSMCRMLRVHPSGFYAWLKKPFSKRAVEDKQTTDRVACQTFQWNGRINEKCLDLAEQPFYKPHLPAYGC